VAPPGRTDSNEPPRQGASARRPGNLNEQEVVDAALRIIRVGGVDELSMRRLSRELGVSTMAAYYYVKDKNQLLDLVASSVLADVTVAPPAEDPWYVRLRSVIDQVDAELRSHPGIGEVLLERMASTHQNVLNGVMSILVSAGFEERSVILAYATIHTYLFGRYKVSTQELPARRPDHTNVETVQSLSRHLSELRARDYYSFGVDTVIEGLRAQLRRQQRQRRAALESVDLSESGLSRPPADQSTRSTATS
jgi:TetR/AcrR family tetracycline transcriptional repressor